MPKSPFASRTRRLVSVSDFQHAPQDRYLIRELETVLRHPDLLSYICRAPYPLDFDTTQAVDGMMANYVWPWPHVCNAIENWVYRELRIKESAGQELFSPGWMEVAEMCDLCSLRPYRRGSEGFEFGLYPRGDDFASRCDLLESVIECLPFHTPVRMGTYVRLPYFPMGSRFDFCPLLEDGWIDQAIVEMCETCARMHADEFARLPAVDYHPFAWHRHYPRRTSWASPTASSREVFDSYRKEAAKGIQSFSGERKEIDGRPYIRWDSYADWERRVVPGDLMQQWLRGEGLVISTWNRWIYDNSDFSTIDLCDCTVTSICDPVCDYWEQSSPLYQTTVSREEANNLVNRRDRAITDLLALASSTMGGTALTALQTEIEMVLSRDGPLKKESLADKVGCNPATMFKPGGLRELCKWGRVYNDRKQGGYCLRASKKLL